MNAPPTSPGRAVKAALLLALPLASLLAGCSGEEQSRRARTVPVVTTEAVSRTQPLEVVSIGTVEAYNTVSVKSQVGGIVDEVYFRDGQDVEAGDRLFLVDTAPFEAARKAAEAKLDGDRATLANMETRLKRYGELAKKEYITAQEQSDMETGVDAMRATVRSDEAALERAVLDLQYCSIEAPIPGRMGTRLIDRGNVVKANADNPMAVIRQIEPVYVRFTLAQRYLGDLLNRSQEEELEVLAWVTGDEENVHTGKLVFVDNTVDPATGTIALKAEFPNERRALWPGEFVNVRLVLREIENALVVPAHAIGTSQQGDFLFVVAADSTAEMRPVTVAYRLDGDAVIDSGVTAGERVVVDGLLLLRTGVKVAEKQPVGEGGAANR